MDPMSLMLGVGGMAASMFGQSQTNKMQQQMMQQQQSFQERMSSTAYQRASSDMQAAGLNPMMMFGSGSAASSPAGAVPSAQVKSGLDSDVIQKNVSTAVQSRVANATIDNLVAQNAKIKAETLTEGVRPALVRADTALRGAQRATERERPELVRQQGFNTATDTARVGNLMPTYRNAGRTAQNELDINETVRRLLDQAGYGGRKTDEILSPISDIVNSARSVQRMRPQTTTRSSTRRTDYDRDGQTTTFDERFHGVR